MLPRPPLLLVTDRLQADRPLQYIVEAALDAGCRWVMLREKDLHRDERCRLAERILRLCRDRAATLVINSDVECARNVGADGVHVSAETALDALRSDLPTDALVGVSAHDAAELRATDVEGADYATLSPVFPSASKPGYGPALGLATFERLVKATSIPVLALGGVGRHNARDCMKAGAAGVAVMGAVMASQWPGESTQHIVETLNG